MQEIIKLLESWEKFKQSGYPSELSSFGQWLQLNASDQDAAQASSGTTNSQIGFLLGTLIGYAEAWSKLTFRGLPITGFVDYGIIKYVQQVVSATKNEIAERSIAEKSTIFESLKRLNKKGIIKEQIDKDDKRVRRVSLTHKGSMLCDELDQKVTHLSDLLVGDLNEQEKKDTIDILAKLNHFHAKLYKEKSRTQIIETFSL